MKRRILVLMLVVLALLLTVSGAVAESVGNGFTYQGFLKDDGSSPTAAYDFEFRLYDAPTEESQVGSVVTLENVEVVNGLFNSNVGQTDNLVKAI